jgi:ArsR family transcriptional regulator
MKLSPSCCGCFAGLSCESRLEIITLLQTKEKLSVTDIAKHFKVTQPTISHHLKFLEEAGLLSSIKDGRKVYYSLHPSCNKKGCNIFN